MIVSMTRVRRAALAATAVGALAAVLSGCGSSGGGGSSSGSAIKLAFVGDLTAQTGSIGSGLLSGIKTEIDTVNAAGGVNGRKIDLQVTDDASDPSKARVAVQGYSADGVIGILGANESAVWTGLASVVAEYPMVLISVGIADAQVAPPQPYLYRSNLGPQDFPQTQISFTKDVLIAQGKVPAKPKVAIFGYNSPSVDADVAGVKKLLPQEGWSLVENQRFDTTATSATTQATAVAGAHPDVVFAYLLDSDATFAVRELRQQGYTGPIVEATGANAQTTFSALNDANYFSESAFAFPFDTSNPAVTQMIDEAKKTGNAKNTSTPFYTQGYMQAKTVVAALQKCPDKCDAKAFNSAIEGIGTIDTGLTKNFGAGPTRHELPGAVQFYAWDSAAKAVKPVGDSVTLQR